MLDSNSFIAILTGSREVALQSSTVRSWHVTWLHHTLTWLISISATMLWICPHCSGFPQRSVIPTARLRSWTSATITSRVRTWSTSGMCFLEKTWIWESWTSATILYRIQEWKFSQMDWRAPTVILKFWSKSNLPQTSFISDSKHTDKEEYSAE